MARTNLFGLGWPDLLPVINKILQHTNVNKDKDFMPAQSRHVGQHAVRTVKT